MVTRKSVKNGEIIHDMPCGHQRKVSKRNFKMKNVILSTAVTVCVMAILVLSTEANEFRYHRPRPGGPYFKLILVSDNGSQPVFTNDTSYNNASITNWTTKEPAIGATVRGIDEDVYDNDYENENIPEDEEIDQDVDNDEINRGGLEWENQKTPQEELNQMIEGLDNLLSNDSAVVTINDVSDAFDQMDVLLSTDDEALEFPCTVLTALDTLGARADLNGSAAVSAARRNVAVMMADSVPEKPVRGLRVSTTTDGFTEDTLQILEDRVDPTTLTSHDTEAVVNLPASLAESSRRISFVVFRSDRAFLRHDSNQYEVNSKIISVKVENFTEMGHGEVIDIHLKPSTYELPRNMTRACAYWHFAENDTGYWAQEGCIFIKSSTGLLDVCRCTHLTHFAEILVPKPVFSENNETALEIVTLIGCFLSLFGLLIIGLTAVVFRSWRNDFNNKIWLQLSIALLINVTSFLIIVFYRFESYSIFCMVVGVLLHYAVLASFCWMLVAGIISYRKLVLVFARNPKRRLLKASAFSWLVPLIIVATLVFVAPQSYTRRFGGEAPIGGFCYPSELGLWLTVFAPIAIVVASNWIIFILIIRSVFGTKNIQKHGDSGDMIRRASVSCLLVFLFGLPWVFGLFAYNIVAAYFFTFTTSYQGFVLFIFFVVINTKTRGMWLNKLHITKKSTVVSSSLKISKNSPVSNESEQSPFIEPSSTRTNITSLASNFSDKQPVMYNVTSDSAVIDASHYKSKDSDIDSYITARSHENFSEDELFKSTEGITDIKEDLNENYEVRISSPNIESFSDDSGQPNKDVTVCEITENLSLKKEDHSSGISVALLKINTSGRDEVRGNSSQETDHDDEIDDTMEPQINVYSVTTQNASLIS